MTAESLPDGAHKLLLHVCCAPCSGYMIETLAASHIDFSLFFYNPNIHPVQEYEVRKAENQRFATQHHIPFIDADYDPGHWFERVKGFEDAPERGERCTLCFDMRFEHTALYASEHGFSVICSSLGISRWKDLAQVTASGERAAARYPGMRYWTHPWRKQGGSERTLEVSRREAFYKQQYCGCVYSLRDANTWRAQNGRARIKPGT